MKTSNDTLTYFFLSVNFHGEFLVLVRNLQYLAPSRYRHIAIRKIFFAEVKRGEWEKTELNFMWSLLTDYFLDAVGGATCGSATTVMQWAGLPVDQRLQ